MFFALSKTLDFLLHPVNVLGLLSIASVVFLFFNRRRLAKLFGAGVIGGWLLVGYVPLATAILTEFENIVARPESLDLKAFDCIIVLGGGTGYGLVPLLRDEASLLESAERLTKAVEFSRKSNDLKIVHTGGSGMLFHKGLTESDVATRFFDEQGVAKSRLIFENDSRNTYENAVFSKKVLKENNLSRPLVITAALQMPRASKTFSAVFGEQKITFYPVDYRTSGEIDWLHYSWTDGARQWNLALRELVGLFVYKITGKL
jgi:uncharacterized SAM-binding protein YcdF (DUF218 family)